MLTSDLVWFIWKKYISRYKKNHDAMRIKWFELKHLIPSRSLLVLQVEETQRKHDLLVQIVQKDQDHKRRLVSINTECDQFSESLPVNDKLLCQSSRGTSKSASSSRSRPRTDWENRGSRQPAPRSTIMTTMSSTVPVWWRHAPRRRGWVVNSVYSFVLKIYDEGHN